jgi:hypothetical protein
MCSKPLALCFPSNIGDIINGMTDTMLCCASPTMQGLEDVTRTRDGLQRVPLMNGIGAAVFADDITQQEMAAAAASLARYAADHGCAAAAKAVHHMEMDSSKVAEGAVAAR